MIDWTYIVLILTLLVSIGIFFKEDDKNRKTVKVVLGL